MTEILCCWPRDRKKNNGTQNSKTKKDRKCPVPVSMWSTRNSRACLGNCRLLWKGGFTEIYPVYTSCQAILPCSVNTQKCIRMFTKHIQGGS